MAAAFEREFRVVVLDEPMLVHRGCHGVDRAALVDALTSNYQAGRLPPHPAEVHASVLAMATSVFEDPATVQVLGRRRPARIGTHIATIELRPGRGVCVADTGSRGHWSGVGDPRHARRHGPNGPENPIAHDPCCAR